MKLIAFVHKKRLNALNPLQGNTMEQCKVHLVPYVEEHSNVHPWYYELANPFFLECHGTFPISSVVDLKSKLAITHYSANLQNLIDY